MAKVLTIDDEWMHNELTVILLNKSGVTDVVAKTSGMEAMEYLEECEELQTFPDIIFVDINMPGINGFMFVELYEEKFDAFDKRIIMLSSSILVSDKEEALKHRSVLAFWDKPLSRSKITELFQTAG